MKPVTGRFREARLYLIYVISPFRPGVRVPTFQQPRAFTGTLDPNLTSDDLTVIVDEGRRQLDRQLADLEKIRNRAGALVTVCLAELAALSAGATRIFTHTLATIVWAVSAVMVILALAGAVALLSNQAGFGRLETTGLAVQKSSVRRVAAYSYAKTVGEGEQTIATRVTVFRDAVLLAALAAILYAAVWPVATFGNGLAPNPAATPSPTTANCAQSSQQPAIGGPPCPTSTPTLASPTAPQTTTTTILPSPLHVSPNP